MHYLNKEGLISSNAYIVDTKGENSKRVGIENNLILNAMAGGKFLSLCSQDQIAIIDPSTGKIDRTIDCENLNIDSVLCGFDDRFFLINSGKLFCYDLEGTLLFSIEDEKLYDYNFEMGMFNQGDNIYIPISPSDFREADFYQIEKKELVKVSDSNTADLQCDEMSKNYFFGQDGEYVFDLVNSTLTKIADFNSMDIIPESKSVSTPASYMGIDDQHFVKFCTYTDQSVEVLLFNYDSSIDYSKATKITVGGYRIKYDLGIRWMQYLFNKENNGYRIVLEDYGDRFPYYDPNNPNKGINANLDLLKYFKDGHQPDIYYGTFFDYDYMGKNGEIMDMMTLNSRGEDSALEDITSSILNATVTNGHLYRIFSSYCLDGFWGKSKWFGSDDITIYDLKQKSDEMGIPVVNSYCTEDIVYGCINYPMKEYAYVPDKPLTIEKVRDMVGFALECGVVDSSQLTTISDVSDIQDDKYLIGYGGIGNLYNMSFSVKKEDIYFLGYPSVYGSSHLASPDGLVAISSDTPYVDECWRAVRLMLSEDIQKVLVLNQRIPVNDKILRESCKYAEDPKSVPSDDPLYYSYYAKNDPVDSKSVDSFISAIDSVDTVQTYDWGVWNIIYEEIKTYQTGKTSDQIADSIYNRVITYVKENY